MEKRGFVYSIGLEEEVLRDEGDRLMYEMIVNDGESIKWVCDISSKKMEIHVPDKNSLCENEMNYIENDIIDLNANGERWEGSSLNSLPFGFGRIYDSNNMLHYCGFMYEGKKICFGEEYYKDGKTVEYRGNFINNLRHGWGILYDMRGSPIFEGNWHFGENSRKSSKLRIPSNCNNSRLLTYNVKELIIEDDCFVTIRKLHIENNCILERLKIGNGCFVEVDELVIGDCEYLKSIIIGQRSFISRENGKTGVFIIHDCAKLELIDFSNDSFLYYSEKFELKSDILMVW